MKKFNTSFTHLIYLFCLILFPIQHCYCQSPYAGNWEGIFMNDFKVIITFEMHEKDIYKGSLKMYSQDNQIQNDEITKITLKNNQCEFIIPAKETTFKGDFNQNLTELSGHFIFSDGSKHELQVAKKSHEDINGANSVEDFRSKEKKIYSVQELMDDLNFLFSKLKERHPKLYSYTSEDNFDQLFKGLNEEIKPGLTTKEFYLLASTLTNAVKCSHTGIRLPVSYQKSAETYGNFFPLNIFFSNDKAYYLSGNKNTDINVIPGTEVISINERPVSEIINRIFLLIPADGNNLTTKYYELNRNFHSLFYPIDNSADFNVKFRTKASGVDLVLKASKHKEPDLNYPSNYETQNVEFKLLTNNSTGILRIPTFAIKDMEQYFQQLDSIFSQLNAQKTSNLVLDLRDNKGGHPIFAAQLFSYLTSKDFIYFKRNEEIKEFEPLYNSMQPNELNYNGKIFVFVNGGCLSTTGHLISLLKYHTDAVFIGEEPGSTNRCNDFSTQFFLPNTKLELNVPGTTFETPVSGLSMNESFPIDYKVSVTVNDILNGKRPYMERLQMLTGI